MATDGPERLVKAALVRLAAERSLAIDEVDAADAAGLYAVHGSSAAWVALGLGSPPDARPLYVGKAEDSLAARDVRTHFETGKTGSSTLRRSLAALLADQLDLVAMPRNPARPGYFSNYGLELEGDARLTAWMRAHLTLAVWPAPPGTGLAMVEGAVITKLSPPLNLAGVLTPWSSTLSMARARMADAARRWPQRR